MRARFHGWTAAMASVALGVSLLLPARVAAQTSPPPQPALRETLERLGRAAAALNHSLPSLTCQEAATSDRLENGKVKEHVTFTGTLRAMRDLDGTLRESMTMTEANGGAVKGRNLSLPFYIGGGFDNAMFYFSPERQACYQYTLSSGRLDFETAPDIATHEQCRDDGARGYALLSEDGAIKHMERTVAPEATQRFNLVPFAAIDFAPVELNGRTYLLSSHMVSQLTRGKQVSRFEADFSACRLFAVSVTIGPASQVPDISTQKP